MKYLFALLMVSACASKPNVPIGEKWAHLRDENNNTVASYNLETKEAVYQVTPDEAFKRLIELVLEKQSAPIQPKEQKPAEKKTKAGKK
jgi:hypothetical protein